jgi:glyoxylase I family protein
LLLAGLDVNPDRPDDRLPYAGAWFWVGSQMIHLMELPDPDPKDGRPEHGGRDRHACVTVKSIEPLENRLQNMGVTYTKSKSGRAALFFRDPDMNVLEVAEA